VNGRVLVVDDDADMCRLVALSLRRRGYEVTWRTSGVEALDVIGREGADVVVTDIDMDGMDGFELCEWVVQNRPEIPVAMLTAFGNLDTAVAAMRAGAADFITKPPEPEALARTVERVLQHRALRDEVRELEQSLREPPALADLLLTSPGMQPVADVLRRIAASDTSVLITGESGTGKELVARALHASGPRAQRPFVAINCAAVPESLLESELFGYLRGAFTGAHGDHPGLFMQADGGTLFFDEIADLPLPLQPKLLRALQERAVRPIGGEVEVPFDVRVVAATNRDLAAAVREGRFRQDLYFRIDVIELELPALRARGHDVLLLAQQFIARYAGQSGKDVVGLSTAAAEQLLAYSWPGNVRELQNCIERAVALTRYDRITVDDLPEPVRQARRARAIAAEHDPGALLPLDEIERRHIVRALAAVRGNKTVAAEVLGVDRKTLSRKLARYSERN
jgi:two-component system response regulator HydG